MPGRSPNPSWCLKVHSRNRRTPSYLKSGPCRVFFTSFTFCFHFSFFSFFLLSLSFLFFAFIKFITFQNSTNFFQISKLKKNVNSHFQIRDLSQISWTFFKIMNYLSTLLWTSFKFVTFFLIFANIVRITIFFQIHELFTILQTFFQISWTISKNENFEIKFMNFLKNCQLFPFSKNRRVNSPWSTINGRRSTSYPIFFKKTQLGYPIYSGHDRQLS